MRILVTGSNGYIGSKVVKELCDLGHEVIATDIMSNNIDKRAVFIQADFFQEKENWFSFFNCPDVCLHLAWRDGFAHNSQKHILDLSAHYRFLCNLIDNGLKHIAVMGSMHEIGYYVGAVDENTPCNPMSLYGVAKNALRKAIELYSKSKNCRFQWLRAYYIYGEDSFGNSIFCKIRQAVKEGETTFPLTSGKNQCDFIQIDELAKDIALSISQEEVLGIINVCSGKPVSLGEQVEWYVKHNKLNISFEYGKFPDRPYDSPCIYGDSSKISKIIQQHSLKESK